MSILDNIEIRPNLSELTDNLLHTGDLSLFEKYINTLPEGTGENVIYFCERVVIGKLSNHNVIYFYFVHKHGRVNATRLVFTLKLQKTQFLIDLKPEIASKFEKWKASSRFADNYKIYTIPHHDDDLVILLQYIYMWSKHRAIKYKHAEQFEKYW